MKARIIELSKRTTQKYPLLGHIAVLASGTAVAQMVALIASIFTARMFTPEEFGQFAIYGSLVAIAATVASLRMDLTIVLPESADEARRIVRIATISNMIVAAVVAAAAFALHGLIVDVYGSEDLARWMPLAGLSVFFLAQATVLQYWFNRNKDYRTISLNRVQQMVGSSGGQVAAGLLGQRHLLGLILGTMVGPAFAYFNLRRKSHAVREPIPAGVASKRDLLIRYKKMPLLNLPNALIDGIRINGIPLMIGLVALDSVGQFSRAWTIMMVPIGLMNGAVSQVFFQKLSRVEPGDMRPLVAATIKRALLITVFPFGLIYILAPWMFLFLFGPQWDMSGDIARALTPWLAMQLVTSPISTLFVVTENQEWLLIFSIVFAATPLSLLFFSPLALVPTLTIIGFAMAFLLVVLLVMAMIAATGFDKRAERALA
nr:oligosaccharide flippase family protein [Helcobacillus massiliensis]